MISGEDSLQNMFGNVRLGCRVPNSTNDPLRKHVGTNYLCITGRAFLLCFFFFN